jgi:cyanuric acid amidohydrolase
MLSTIAMARSLLESAMPRASSAPHRAGHVEFLSLPMSAPDDLSALQARLARDVDPRDIVAVFVKTEGNGLDNDWSRPLAIRALGDLLGAGAADEPPIWVVSGGCEGFTTPHMLVVVHRAAPRGGRGRAADGPVLVASYARSRPLAASELGTGAQVDACADALRQACERLGLPPADVVYAHAVAPWFDERLAPGAGTPLANDAHASKPFTRAACALGAAVALDGVPRRAALRALATADRSVHGSRCAVTAGPTGGVVQVLVFGHLPADRVPAARRGAAPGRPSQTIRCMTMTDALDADAVRRCAAPAAGAVRAMQDPAAEPVRGAPPVAVLCKADPPPAGRLRGERVALGNDSDIHAFRHYRAAMSGLLAAVTGGTRSFIGGGAEHQCPHGGVLLAMVIDEEHRS